MRRLWLVALLVLLVAGCSSQESALEVEDGPLAFVVMGNSATYYPPGNGMIDRLPVILEEDFGVDVDLRDWTVPADDSSALVERLENNEGLRADLADADVIVFVVPFDGWAMPLMNISGAPGADPAGCGGDDGEECLREVLDLFKDNTEKVFQEVTAIADPSETLIRVMDYILVHMEDLGDTLETVAPYWVESQDYVEEVAAEYGIPVAKVMERFCGSECLDNPLDAGLIADDQEHPTDEGAEIITQMIHDLGYDLAVSER